MESKVVSRNGSEEDNFENKSDTNLCDKVFLRFQTDHEFNDSRIIEINENYQCNSTYTIAIYRRKLISIFWIIVNEIITFIIVAKTFETCRQKFCYQRYSHCC